MTDAKGFKAECGCQLTEVTIDGLVGTDQVWCAKHSQYDPDTNRPQTIIKNK